MGLHAYRTASRTISVKTGTYGPAHDPYTYQEITVKRPEWVDVTLHQGLGMRLEYTKGKSKLNLTTDRRDVKLSDAEMVTIFERHLGCSLIAFKRACYRIHSRCRECGGPPVKSVAGYPGESFDLCANGHVVSSDFNENAII